MPTLTDYCNLAPQLPQKAEPSSTGVPHCGQKPALVGWAGSEGGEANLFRLLIRYLINIPTTNTAMIAIINFSTLSP